MVPNRAAGPAWQGRRGPRERSPRASREEPRHSGLHEQMPLRSCLNPRILNLRPPGQQSPACPLPRTTHQAGWGWAAWPRPGRGRRQGALRRAGRRPGHAAGPGRVGTCETRAGGRGRGSRSSELGSWGSSCPPTPHLDLRPWTPGHPGLCRRPLPTTAWEEAAARPGGVEELQVQQAAHPQQEVGLRACGEGTAGLSCAQEGGGGLGTRVHSGAPA